jgi:hypothetical protein
VSLVAGIDYSTHAIDVVMIDEETLKPEWHRIDVEGCDGFERARAVRRSIAARYGHRRLWDDVLAVGIEEPRGYGAGHLYRIQGAILQCLPPDTLVQPWVPSEWRKAVGLKGNASKDDVREHANRLSLNATYDWPQDGADAYCIARATLQAIERSTE